MFTFALSLGIYVYLLLFLGVLGLWYPVLINSISVIYGVGIVIFFKPWRIDVTSKFIKKKSEIAVIFLLVPLAIINIIGALGPELAFDALWYHLTLPKLYLLAHEKVFIPGGLLYYSAMPQFGETLYLAALAMGNEILAKFIHFSFGIFSCIALYLLSRKYLSRFYSLLVVLIFYSNLVVAWESITAYIDLIRTFFEIMAFWSFMNWVSNRKQKNLVLSAIFLGFAIATKLLALGTLGIFLILLFFVERGLTRLIKHILLYIGVVFVTISPWLIFSYVNTHNPIYPFFTPLYPTHFDSSIFYPVRILIDFWTLFVKEADPVSPIYLICMPLVAILFKTFLKEERIIMIYSFLALFVWYITPRTGGGRFLLPYLPVFSLLLMIIIEKIRTSNKFLFSYTLVLIFFLACITIFYRGLANARYIPVILGARTKDEFLTTHLHFSFGDFYDTDGYFAKSIKPADTVLLFGFHNSYYIHFPFIDSSWVKKGDRFNYIATQNTSLPPRFSDWRKVYENKKTGVSLYNKEGKIWTYSP